MNEFEPYHWLLLGAVWGALQVYFYPMVYRDWKRRRELRRETAILDARMEEAESTSWISRDWLDNFSANEPPEPGVYLDDAGEWQSGQEHSHD